ELRAGGGAGGGTPPGEDGPRPVEDDGPRVSGAAGELAAARKRHEAVLVAVEDEDGGAQSAETVPEIEDVAGKEVGAGRGGVGGEEVTGGGDGLVVGDAGAEGDLDEAATERGVAVLEELAELGGDLEARGGGAEDEA